VLHFESKEFSDVIVLQRIIESLARPFSHPMTVAELQALLRSHYDAPLQPRPTRPGVHIADSMNARFEPIFNHWAHSLVLSHAPADAVVEKLQRCGDSLDFIKLAAAKDLGTRSQQRS
jgi:hypothetical protein